MEKNWKKFQIAEKTERGTLWNFSTCILSENIKKLKRGPFGEFFSEKSLTEPKIL